MEERRREWIVGGQNKWLVSLRLISWGDGTRIGFSGRKDIGSCEKWPAVAKREAVLGGSGKGVDDIT